MDADRRGSSPFTADSTSAADPVPERPVLARVAAIAVPFLGGPFVGTALAAMLVPGSTAAQLLSFFPLSLSLMVGLYAWIGLAVFTLLGRFLARLFGHTSRETPLFRDEIPPGSFVFVPVGATFMGVAGLACGLLPTSHGFLLVTAAYLLIGAAYGAALHRLARSGYLQFPDEL